MNEWMNEWMNRFSNINVQFSHILIHIFRGYTLQSNINQTPNILILLQTLEA